MLRIGIAVMFALGCFLLTPTRLHAQASKQLDERAKKVATSQEQSWKQVDEINKETDQTRGRLQQSRQSGTQASQKSGYSVKKTTVGSRSAYKKPAAPKTKRKKK
jgi:hypothetical protein